MNEMKIINHNKHIAIYVITCESPSSRFSVLSVYFCSASVWLGGKPAPFYTLAGQHRDREAFCTAVILSSTFTSHPETPASTQMLIIGIVQKVNAMPSIRDHKNSWGTSEICSTLEYFKQMFPFSHELALGFPGSHQTNFYLGKRCLLYNEK